MCVSFSLSRFSTLLLQNSYRTKWDKWSTEHLGIKYPLILAKMKYKLTSKDSRSLTRIGKDMFPLMTLDAA